MARKNVVTKLEDLQGTLKDAKYLLDTARMEASQEWLNASVSEQEAIIAVAMEKMLMIRTKHDAAAKKIPVLLSTVTRREQELAEFVNRGTINKVEDMTSKLREYAERLRNSGVTEAQIHAALNGG